MRWKPDEFSAELKTATGAYDREAASALCSQLIQHLRARVEPYPLDDATLDLQLLRSGRYFELMEQTADAYLRAGLVAPVIHRQLAQSLLDQGNVSAGLAILREIVANEATTPAELAEARGLIGRAHKQNYVDAADSRPPHNRRALLEAFDSYYSVYELDPAAHL